MWPFLFSVFYYALLFLSIDTRQGQEKFQDCMKKTTPDTLFSVRGVVGFTPVGDIGRFSEIAQLVIIYTPRREKDRNFLYKRNKIW